MSVQSVVQTVGMRKGSGSNGRCFSATITKIIPVPGVPPERDLRIFRLLPNFDFPAFEPGQYCTIGLGRFEWSDPTSMLWRPYSIVSAPHELPEIELCVERIPPGAGTADTSLTPRLWGLGVGERVAIQPRAKGVFTLFDREEMREEMSDWRQKITVIGLVATVAGIAPFVSILRAYQHGFYEGIAAEELLFCIFHGASSQYELVYREELESMADKSLDLFYFSSVSQGPGEERPPYSGHNLDWDGEIGRVGDLLPRYFRDLGILPWPNYRWFLCGHEGMLAQVAFGCHKFDKEFREVEKGQKPLGWLMRYGFDRAQVRKEYW